MEAPDCPRLKDIKLTNNAVKAQEMDDRDDRPENEMTSMAKEQMT